jgi:Fe-S cluster biogenesis protein NfuA
VNRSFAITSEIDRRNGSVCRFTVERTLQIGSLTFEDKEAARESLLARKIFDVPGIAKISLIGKLLVVTKTETVEWTDLRERIEAILEAYLTSPLALSPEQVEDQMQLLGRTPSEKVQYLLNQRINPGVAEHAGFVQLIDIRDNRVYVRLSGGCQGCSAADFTLRQGIEAIIKGVMPEIREVIDVTDHGAGTNPYFRRQAYSH